MVAVGVALAAAGFAGQSLLLYFHSLLNISLVSTK